MARFKYANDPRSKPRARYAPYGRGGRGRADMPRAPGRYSRPIESPRPYNPLKPRGVPFGRRAAGRLAAGARGSRAGRLLGPAGMAAGFIIPWLLPDPIDYFFPTYPEQPPVPEGPPGPGPGWTLAYQCAAATKPLCTPRYRGAYGASCSGVYSITAWPGGSTQVHQNNVSYYAARFYADDPSKQCVLPYWQMDRWTRNPGHVGDPASTAIPTPPAQPAVPPRFKVPPLEVPIPIGDLPGALPWGPPYQAPPAPPVYSRPRMRPKGWPEAPSADYGPSNKPGGKPNPPYWPNPNLPPEQPPPPGEVQKKEKLFGKLLPLQKFFHELTEIVDLIDVIFDSIPDAPKGLSLDEKVKYIYENYDKIDIPQLMINWGWNWWEDFAVGMSNAWAKKAIARAVKKGYGVKRPGGGAGPALYQP